MHQAGQLTSAACNRPAGQRSCYIVALNRSSQTFPSLAEMRLNRLKSAEADEQLEFHCSAAPLAGTYHGMRIHTRISLSDLQSS